METLNADLLRAKLTEPTIETGYLGPGIWVRIQRRFRIRQTEWLLAFITFLWGGILLLPGNTFNLPDYSGFRGIFGNEEILGLAMSLMGLLRLAGLFVNGARKNVTPHIRMVSAIIGCLVFFGICYCYVLSGIISDWLAIYPPFVIVEIINAHNAGRDVGESQGGRTSQVR